MTAPWIAVGVGLAACVAHLAFVGVGIARLLTSRLLRGRLGPSSVEVLYVGGTVLLAGLSGAVVLGVLGPPPSALGARTWWVWAAVVVVTTVLVLLPRADVREPSALRRVLLCLGGGAEELLWRGVAIAALAPTGVGAPASHLLATLGFAGLHTARYGRRGVLFILVFSVAMSVLSVTFGLLCAVAAHVAWNASTALRRRRAPVPQTPGPTVRDPADEW